MFPAADLPPSEGTYLLPVVLGIGRNTLMNTPVLRIYCLATRLCFISIFRTFHHHLACQQSGFLMLANKVEELETGQQSFGNAGGEKLFARVAELVEHQHEEDAHAVTYQELQDQHWGADIQVEVCSINVPHQQEEGVLHQPHDVVHGHAVPVLGFANQVGVTELHLHCRPAEHVNASVQEREKAQDDGSAHPAQFLLYVLRKWGLAKPEENPWVEAET